MIIDTLALHNLVVGHFKRQRKVFPYHTNRASEIGHPCLRYLVLSRTRWPDKMLVDVVLQQIFNEGNMHEEAVKKTLTEVGFELTQQQRSYFEAPQNISGHLDTFISHRHLIPKSIPAEIKSMSSSNWDSINRYSDLVNHKQYYIRKYPAQIQFYMYLTECEHGLFILKNKQTGQLKFISVEFDYDYVERLLKKAEKINKYVTEKIYPDETTDELAICQSCPFRHICFKEQDYGKGLIILDDAVIADKIKRMLQLKETAQEHDRLKKEVGDTVKARAQTDRPDDKRAEFIIGDFVCNTTKVNGTKYNIPKDIKDQYAEDNVYWKFGGVMSL